MKNIVLLVTDTYRYDNLFREGVDGAGVKSNRVHTPYLDSFAADHAASLSRCYTGSFPTIPHRTDLATGRLGWPHYGWQPILDSSPNHIARMLSDCGYSTQLICDCPHLFNSGFNSGFHAAVQNRGQEGDRPLLHLNDPIATVLPDDKTRPEPLFGKANLANTHRWTNRYMQLESDAFSARTSATTVRWLEENYRAAPFFLWVDFFDPHEPWDPPEYMVERYHPDYKGTPMLHPNYGHSNAYTADELENLQAHYRAEAEMVDRHIGRVLEKIHDLDLWKDTVVVVTTDHGISIGEHQRTGKSNIHPADKRYWPIYPEVSHVPFLVAAPGVEGGAVKDFFFQAMDILPTLKDLSGAPIEPPEPMQGASAAGILHGSTGHTRDYAVSGCCIQSDKAGVPEKATVPFLTTDTWGYAPVGAEGAPELYDLRVDPYAEQNVAADHSSVVAELHQLLLAHLSDFGAGKDVLELWQSPIPGSGSWAIDYQRVNRR